MLWGEKGRWLNASNSSKIGDPPCPSSFGFRGRYRTGVYLLGEVLYHLLGNQNPLTLSGLLVLDSGRSRGILQRLKAFYDPKFKDEYNSIVQREGDFKSAASGKSRVWVKKRASRGGNILPARSLTQAGAPAHGKKKAGSPATRRQLLNNCSEKSRREVPRVIPSEKRRDPGPAPTEMPGGGKREETTTTEERKRVDLV